MTTARFPPALIDGALVVLALLDAVSSNPSGSVESVVAIVAALGLSVRRRWPYPSFALAMGALYIGYVVVAPLVALYTVAALRPGKRALAVCAGVAALGYYLPWPPSLLRWQGLSSWTSEVIYTAAFVGAPVALGLLARTRRELADRLAEVRAGREREERYLAERVRATERARLAREMHDVVSHQVSLVAVQAGALTAAATDDLSRETGESIRRLSVRTLDELRHMVGVLRGSGGEPVPLTPQPRVADLPRLVQESGLQVRLDVGELDGGARTEAAERAAFRIVQQALTNVRTHATGAAVTVRVVPETGGLAVSVRNGPPATPVDAGLPSGGHGLVGLRERADLLGGSFDAGPTPDGGFLVSAFLPFGSRTGPDPGDRSHPSA